MNLKASTCFEVYEKHAKELGIKVRNECPCPWCQRARALAEKGVSVST